MANGFIWFDVAVAEEDVADVTAFYASILDGPLAPDNGDGPYRTWFMDGEQPWAAVVRAAGGTAGRWVPYIRVDDLDAAAARAVAAGGSIVLPASDGPAGTSVTLADPAGALVALFKPYG